MNQPFRLIKQTKYGLIWIKNKNTFIKAKRTPLSTLIFQDSCITFLHAAKRTADRVCFTCWINRDPCCSSSTSYKGLFSEAQSGSPVKIFAFKNKKQILVKFVSVKLRFTWPLSILNLISISPSYSITIAAILCLSKFVQAFSTRESGRFEINAVFTQQGIIMLRISMSMRFLGYIFEIHEGVINYFLSI